MQHCPGEDATESMSREYESKLFKICVDLDGTLCTQHEQYVYAEPIQPAIDWLIEQKKAKEAEGKRAIIVVHTARHWDWLFFTKGQLDCWGVPYDTLVMGKPVADVYLDDRAIPFPWETNNGNKEEQREG